MKKLFQHKIFNFLNIKKIEGILFRGLLYSSVSILFFFDYAQTNDGMKFIMGIVTAINALLTIDDYLNYKRNKTIG
jgi:hypothetical protein